MASIEQKIGNAILARIRSHRDDSGEGGGDPDVPAAPARAKIREAQFSDYAGITELKRRWGLVPDPYENWQHLWQDNPALKNSPAKRPIGWVVEAEGQIVGYLGSISSTYRLGDKTLTAVVGSGFVADPTYRAHTVRLMGAFYAQKSVDLNISTTAVEATGKIACAFGCDPLPQKDYETVMFWVLRPYPFAQTVMKKLQVKPGLARFLAPLAAAGVAMDKLFRRRRPRRPATNLAVSEIRAAEMSKEFEDLWLEKVAEGTRLYADRSLEYLLWHYNVPGDRSKTSVICCRKESQLLGYLVIRDEGGQTNGVCRSLVADMLVKRDDPDVIHTLIAAAYEHARKAGSHVLEVQGFPAGIRRLCAQSNPYTRSFSASPFLYKGCEQTLHKTLADGELWYGTPFDGDTTLMPQL